MNPENLDEVDRLRAEVAGYRSAICFETTCTGCAGMLDQLVEAEAETDRLRAENTAQAAALAAVAAVADRIAPHAENMCRFGELEIGVPLRTAVRDIRSALGLDQDGHGKGDPAETPHPDRPCPHEEFAALVAINRIRADDDDATVVGYSADIKVDCRDCGEPFRWVGVDAGASPRGPMCSIDETELRAPLRPASADPDFGLGLPGFAVRANQSRDGGESHG